MSVSIFPFRDCPQSSLLALKHLRKNKIHFLIFQFFFSIFLLKQDFFHISVVTKAFSRSPVTSVLLLPMRNSVCSQPNLNTHTRGKKVLASLAFFLIFLHLTQCQLYSDQDSGPTWTCQSPIRGRDVACGLGKLFPRRPRGCLFTTFPVV